MEYITLKQAKIPLSKRIEKLEKAEAKHEMEINTLATSLTLTGLRIPDWRPFAISSIIGAALALIVVAIVAVI